MDELECTSLLDGVRKILARSTGGSGDLSEFGGVVLRQLPVAQRVVPQEDIRGEVMDFIVQQIEDTDLSPTYVWALATKVANKISEAILSNIQINALNEVSKKELDSLCTRIEADPSILEVRASSSSISVKALRNARRTMEDRHVLITDLNQVAGLEASPSYEYFAVFDGHGGREAANYCAAHLHLVLAEQIRSGLPAPAAIEKAFKIVDANFCDRALEMARKAGSTAVVALIVDKKTLHIGWLGDSEAVLARDGQALGLVKPHKPSVISEQERIERLGGEVISLMGVHRVNANLAVSRAIGDVEHKPYVSNDAEVNTVELDDACDFLVLGCDGLFDLMSYQDVVVNAYHSALTRRFDTSVAENLTRAAISNGSTDNVTTIVVNLRDPKKWHFENVVFPKSEAAAAVADRVTPSTGKQLNGSCETVAASLSLTGGDSSPVREVAAGFVSDAVEMALSKVNGTPPSNLDPVCDLSPPEEEQRDLRASLKDDTPEADRLNPDAPEFVPSFPTASRAPELPNQSSSDENNGATVITASPATGGMPKSESRDELVYEIDRELGTAPQAVQAELVNLDVSSGASVSAMKAADGLSDSDEDLNSMVVHEDQPQPEIKLSELIVREQHIHVIPEESPSEEQTSPLPATEAMIGAREPLIGRDGVVDQLVDLSGESETSARAQASGDAEPVFGSAKGLDEAAAGSSQNVVESPRVCEDLVDLASQVLEADVLERIESSEPCKPACGAHEAHAPLKIEDSQYLFSAEVGVHEETIVPRAQPLLFENEEPKLTEHSLIDAMENLMLDEGPKVVDAIEKPPRAPAPANVVPERAPGEVVPEEHRAEQHPDIEAHSIGLESVKDVVEKLSAVGETKEEAVGAPVIPDSIPEAEGVLDVDSDSDNDAQEWSFVKPVDSRVQTAETQKLSPAAVTSATAAVVAATSVAAAAVATMAKPARETASTTTPTSTRKAAEKATTPSSKSVKSKASPVKAPTSTSGTPAVRAAAKVPASSKTGVRSPAAPQAAGKLATPRTPIAGAKPAAPAKPKVTKASPAAAAAAKPSLPTSPKTTATDKVSSVSRPIPSRAASATKPVASTAAKNPSAPATRAPLSSRAPTTTSTAVSAVRPVAAKSAAARTNAKAAATSLTSANKPTSAALTKKVSAPTVRPAPPKPTAAATGPKKTVTSGATTASAPAARVAAARVAATAAMRSAPKTTASAATTVSSAKPKSGTVKTTSSVGSSKTAPKSPVKKNVKLEKKSEPIAPPVAVEQVAKENGSQTAPPQTNGHPPSHTQDNSSNPNELGPTGSPGTAEQGDVVV
ncbi:flocculation protein FLO11-like [Galendromus occidentalis]|uniref:Flocculation protein FLO11-like n=1 Tax=Galendromus occidentalis TaxID=34638 RepID=A0AAJ6QVV0_9ACAR|nr:flocculation protein FLO11-like [Galendromus occidentalis]